MKKEIIVLGDIELGGGTLTDDFISDRALAKLIRSLKKPHQVDLVLNGDTFDFLKCPYIRHGKATYPRHITEEISISKLHLIYEAHTPVFRALKEFVKSKHNRLYLIIGNHDEDLFYLGVQKEIKQLLGGGKNIYFKLRYRSHRVHVEHGHQYDLLMRSNIDKLFLNYRGVSILNISWISLGVISKFLHLKEQHPFLERIKPVSALFSMYPSLAKKLSWHSFDLFVKSLFYYPFRYYSDPTYSIPRTLLRELYYRLKNVHYELDDIISYFKKTEDPRLHGNKLYVFGHIHHKYVEDNGSWAIVQPDSWKDEYTLDSRSKKLIPKKKNYVRVIVEDGQVDWQLVVQPIKRTPLDSRKVLGREMECIQIAAKEEGYTGSLIG